MLKVNNLNFGYGEVPILKSIEFQVPEGKHFSIIGRSGSGKSTILKAIFGNFDLKEGSIYWKDTQILGPAFNLVVGYPFMKYVAQEFDLMPYANVEETIGKFLSNFYPDKKKKRVDELMDLIELTPWAKTKVSRLSGGQKQRVYLAQSIANLPEIVLLDEPFSHIDNFKKQELRRRIFSYLKRNNVTCIVATHDKEDILGYTDEIMVIEEGETIQMDKAEKLFSNPKNGLVASFFGEYNLFYPHELDGSKESEVILYSHQLRIESEGKFEGEVLNSYYKGTSYLIELLFNKRSILIDHSIPLESGLKVKFNIG
ncbi:ABC transporter ATP-binding protein [Aegicerativicinus sediminis]